MTESSNSTEPTRASESEADESIPLYRSAASSVASGARGAAGAVATGMSVAAAKAKEVVTTAAERVDSLGESRPAGATGAAAGTATRTNSAVLRRTRKARLRVSRVDPWSVMKTAFLFSIAFAIIQFVTVWVVWSVIQSSGAFDSINKAVSDLVSTPGSDNAFHLEDWVNTHKVLGFTALLSAIDVVLMTALSTLFSFLYNLAATVIGGLEVTLAED